MIEKYMAIFGANLRAARKHRRLSQAKLAKLCEPDDGGTPIARPRLANYEQAYLPNITLRTIVIIAKALGYSPIDLLTEGFDPVFADKQAMARRVEDAKAARAHARLVRTKRPKIR